MNTIILGIILDIIGVFILVLTEVINPHHQKIYGQPFKKTYWWNGWRPFYKNTRTLKWVIKWNHKPVVFGMFPPKYKLYLIGFLFILFRFLFQLKFYLV